MEVCVCALCGESTTDLTKESKMWFSNRWCSTFNLEISQHNCSVDIYLGVKLSRQLFISMLRCILYYWVLKIKMSTVKWLLYSGGIMRKNHNQVFLVLLFSNFWNKVTAGCHFACSYLIDYLMMRNRSSQHILLYSSNNHLQEEQIRWNQALSYWWPEGHQWCFSAPYWRIC